jgi:hypothetical protein
MTRPHCTRLLAVLLSAAALAARAAAEEPAKVQPSTGTVQELPRPAAPAETTPGNLLDTGHDWLYRQLQRSLERIDTQFAGSERAPLIVPLSPLRIGLDGELLHREDGLTFTARPEFEATLRLPNIERRFRVFITSTDLTETPGDAAHERSPLRAGVRFGPLAHLDFDLGVRVRLRPAAFAALRWAPEYGAGAVRLYPFVKPYVESGLGFGVSGGLALERWSGHWVARSASYANWLRNDAQTRWTQTFIAGHARAVIQEQRYDRFVAGHDLACGAVARLSLSGDRGSRVSAYEVGVLFKRPLHRGWLYGYLEPVVRWERDAGWHPDAGVRLGLDALFWGLASVPGEVATYCD